MKRKYYSVEDAARIVGCTPDDLIHYGAIGSLSFCALLPGCNSTESVWDSDPEEDFLACQQDSGGRPSDEWLLGPFPLGKLAMRLIEAKADGTINSVYGNSSGIFPIVYTLETPIPAADIHLVIMADELDKFDRQAEDKKPLATTERNTLLTIVAALCDYSAIDCQGRGAASQIAKLTEEIGAAVSDDTVRRALAKIPEALESRMK